MESECGVTKALRLIGSKWTLNIIYVLCESTKRFGQIQRELVGISPRTLSLRLSQLESDGIISKKIFAQIPPRVDYSLTPKGASLRTILTQLDLWGQQQ
jgi:DNA-binding HxlR family transcriptional regulator